MPVFKKVRIRKNSVYFKGKNNQKFVLSRENEVIDNIVFETMDTVESKHHVFKWRMITLFSSFLCFLVMVGAFAIPSILGVGIGSLQFFQIVGALVALPCMFLSVTFGAISHGIKKHIDHLPEWEEMLMFIADNSSTLSMQKRLEIAHGPLRKQSLQIEQNCQTIEEPQKIYYKKK